MTRPNSKSRRARRDFLRALFWGAGAAGLPAWCTACAGDAAGPASAAFIPVSRFSGIGALGEPDANGIRLPPGFSSRVVAVAGEVPVAAGSTPWHVFPDGAAVFARAGGGWVYTSNSETTPQGGASSLVFDAQGRVIGCQRVLSNTRHNCAGGATPWNTWLSCEEVDDGQVWECDPHGLALAVAKPALGLFAHEAVAVQAGTRTVYLTEDAPDGRFYRFVAAAADWPGDGRAAFEQGRLQVMQVMGDPAASQTNPLAVRWIDALNPDAPQRGSRLPESTAFKGGEGIWLHRDIVYFSTKIDNRIWAYDSTAQTLEIIYDFSTATGSDRILSGVDNLTGTAAGEILVAEDEGDMQLCVVLPDRRLVPLLQVVGQDFSEITGPAFSPDGRSLYFSSQRGARNSGGSGITYEVLMPFAV